MKIKHHLINFILVPFFMLDLRYAFPLCIFLFLIFSILRITKVIHWSLLWILSPLILIGIIVFSLFWTTIFMLTTNAMFVGINKMKIEDHPNFILVPISIFVLRYAFPLCIFFFPIFLILQITKVIHWSLLWILSPLILIGIIVYSLIWSFIFVLPKKAMIIGVASIILIPQFLTI